MSYIFELFSYSDYADFLATSGWTELLGPSNAAITFPPFTHTTNTGDNEQVIYLKAPGYWSDDATASPGVAAFILVGNMDNPFPSNGVGGSINVVDEAFASGVGMNFSANNDGTWNFLGLATWSTPSSEYVSGITGFEGATGYVMYIAMNMGTRMVTISLYNQSFSLVHSWTAPDPMPPGLDLTMNNFLWSVSASPISGPDDYTVTASQLILTYTPSSGGGGGRTYYTPGITGNLLSANTTFAMRRV